MTHSCWRNVTNDICKPRIILVLVWRRCVQTRFSHFRCKWPWPLTFDLKFTPHLLVSRVMFALNYKFRVIRRHGTDGRTYGESVVLLVARRTNNRKVAGSRPAKVVCITVLTGNRLGWTVRCGRPPLLLPSCRKLEFRLSALMDSDLAWVNGKSGRQSWCYAGAFQRSIISKAIYH